MSYSVKPEEAELREARQVAEEAIESCKELIEKDQDFELGLSWSILPENEEEKEGFEPIHGWAGFPDSINISFNTEVENWKQRLKTEVAYGYARALFLEKADWENPDIYWHEILVGAFSTAFLEKIVAETSNLGPEADLETLEDRWSEIREELGREFEWIQDIPHEYAYPIGQKLLEKHELEKFPELKKSNVIEAGDELFGE